MHRSRVSIRVLHTKIYQYLVPGSSLACVKVNIRENAVRQGVEVPSSDIPGTRYLVWVVSKIKKKKKLLN